MKGRALLLWVLGGALAASVAVNAYQAWDVSDASMFARAQGVSERCTNDLSIDALGLTTGQREQITSCCGACTKERVRLVRETEHKLKELASALDERPIDRRLVYRLADEVGELKTRLLKSRVHTIIRVRETLTPEQLDLLNVSAQSERKP